MHNTEAKPWKDLVKNRWILFDADAVISITAFEQMYILEEMRSNFASFAFIHPVLLELMNTNSSATRLVRSKLLIDYDFVELPLTQPELKSAVRIQRSLPLKTTASPTDLYLGGALTKYNHALLLTANIKDFPLPIYKREGHILLQKTDSLKLLTLLSIDKDFLVK